MSNIQQAINQAMGTVAVAARLSPDYETKQELHKLSKEQEVIGKQAEAAELRGKDAMDASLIDNLANIKERQMRLAERRFEIDPTKETFEQSIQAKKSYMKFNKVTSDLLVRQEQANQAAKEKQLSKQSQKRNFMEYLKKQPIAGGGTVGQLSPKAQKQIASQYSKGERKKLMDEEDKV